MNTNESLTTKKGQISFLQDFDSTSLPVIIGKPKTDADLKNVILRQLYNRICVAKESFLCLIDNDHYHDSFLVAGHIFETCAVISDIKDNDSKTQIEKINQHSAYSMIARLVNLLEFDNTNRVDEKVQRGYTELVDRLEVYGDSIISDTPKKKHSEMVQLFRDDNVSNEDLVKFIEKSYKHPNPKKCVEGFYDKLIAAMDKPKDEPDVKTEGIMSRDFFTSFYNKYCEIKHSNIFSPELDPDYKKDDILHLVITPMVWVFAYLKKYGLGKSMLPEVLNTPKLLTEYGVVLYSN